jgi:hypothetical protein
LDTIHSKHIPERYAKRYAIEKMQNEAGVVNNLSNRMDEYESAKREFMATALENEISKRSNR